METQTLERPPEAPDETPQDDPATPEPDGPNKPQDEPGSDPKPAAELEVEGDEGYLNTDAGGKAPTDSKLQIVGRAVMVEGQYQKGARIRAMVELEIGGVSFQDKKDGQTGQVVASTRKHSASIVGFAKQS